MLTKLINSGRSFASLLSGRFGNNALATLNDVNQVVDDINFIRNFTDVRILFTQTGTNNPILRIISSGVASSKCSGDCDTGNPDQDCCSKSMDLAQKKNNDNSISALRTGVGVYRLRIQALDKETYPTGLIGATFIIGAPSVLGNRVTVTFNPLVTDPNLLEYTVRTYNDIGTLSDGILSNTLINVSVYRNPDRSRAALPIVRY